jgi:aminopeptidase N
MIHRLPALNLRARYFFAVPLALACASTPTPAPAPAPAVVAETVAVLPPAPPPPSPPDTMAPYRIPSFGPGPVSAWGPLPPGTPHGERQRTFDLLHQILRVRFDWSRHAVVGGTTLRIAALGGAGGELSRIELDAVGMTIKSVKGSNGAALAYEYDGRVLAITPARPIAAGGRTSVTIEYETVRPRKGVYFIDRRHVVWTQGETEDTRYWIPTYDYPNDKTTWEFYIRTARGEKALANGRLIGKRPVGSEMEWQWIQDKPASTYLMSVVTGDYLVLQDKWRSVPIGYWTYPDSVEAAWRGFGRTPRAIELFSTVTNVAYPWAKYDQSVAPDYIFGGMENVTATTQSDNDILHPKGAEPQANADDLVSHELAHQWYGDLLTTRDWANIWLNEGFAEFMQELFREKDKGVDEGAVGRLEAHDQTRAADAAARRPLVYAQWITDPLELFFSGHIYPKGATVLMLLRHELGDSTFWRGMNRYTTRHAYGNVVTEDFRRAMEESSARDLSRFFRQWVYGAGYPVFRVSYAYDSTARRLTVTAAQVQPKDALTGFFEADVAVTVLTDAGAVQGVVPVRDSVSQAAFDLPAAPRSIHWNTGKWVLDTADFPRPVVMLAYQLAHDDDVLGRIEAASLLLPMSARAAQTGAVANGSAPGMRAASPADSVAIAALARAVREDRAWAVRARAVDALSGAPGDWVAAVVAASRDSDPRVRERAAVALARAPADPQVIGRLREMATGDSSLFVRGRAINGLATVEPAAAMPIIREMLEQRSWLDLSRTQAITALGLIDAPEAWTLLMARLDGATSREARVAAIASLLRGARGREAALAAALAPLLDAEDLFIRQAAARALGELGQSSSVASLEARRRVEAESRVINDIDAALAALRKR